MPRQRAALPKPINAGSDQVRAERVPQIVSPNLAHTGLAQASHRRLHVPIDLLTREPVPAAPSLHRAQERVRRLRAHADDSEVVPVDDVVGRLIVQVHRDKARVASAGRRRFGNGRGHLDRAARCVDSHVAHHQARHFFTSQAEAGAKPESGQLAEHAGAFSAAVAVPAVLDDTPKLVERENAEPGRPRRYGFGVRAGSFRGHAGLSIGRGPKASPAPLPLFKSEHARVRRRRGTARAECVNLAGR